MQENTGILQSEEGSALATVLAISVIVLLFIGAILAGIVVQLRFIQRDINKTKALYKAEAQVYHFLSDSTSYFKGKLEIKTDSLGGELKAEPYGGFWDIQSKAIIGGQSQTVRILVGEKPDSLFEHAIVLGDSTSGVTLTGTTSITGNILTSEEGLRTTSFRGVPFRGSFDGEGNYFKENLRFPVFHSERILAQIEEYKSSFVHAELSKFRSNYKGSHQFSSIQSGDTLFYSENVEWNSSQNVRMPNELTIIVDGNFKVNGEYNLGSFTKLIVRDTLRISGKVQGQNLLLYAGEGVEVRGMSAFSAQLITGGNIEVRDQAYLNYPSLLYSAKEFFQGGDSDVIKVTNEAVVDGNVLYAVTTNEVTRDLMHITVGDSAIVRGSIYSLGQTELKGEVKGAVLTYQFYFYDSPTQYINWLKDVSIDVSQRPENFVVPLGFSMSPKYAILNWFLEEE